MTLLAYMLLPWPVVWGSLQLFHDYRLTMALYIVLIGSCTVALRCKNIPGVLRPRKPSHVSTRSHPSWLAGCLLCLEMQITILSFWKLSHGFGMSFKRFSEITGQLHLQPSIWLAMAGVWLVVGNPIVEEKFWRGTMYYHVRSHMRMPWAVGLTTLFFASWHWLILSLFLPAGWALFITFCVGLGGIQFALMYERTGRLLSSVLLHAFGADLPIVAIIYQSVWAGQHAVK